MNACFILEVSDYQETYISLFWEMFFIEKSLLWIFDRKYKTELKCLKD